MIRLNVPVIEEDDLRAVREVLETGFLVQGARVLAFEKAFAERVGVPHAVAVTNCTAALHLALLALDVRAGDIVLVPAFSWLATANVVELCGATPVFVDIDAHDFNMSPAALETSLARLTRVEETRRRIRAVMPVHAFGRMASTARIVEIAALHKIPVIEDAACGLGAKENGREAGTIGLMGCFSFHPRKAITTGEGGVITTSDEKIAKHLRALRNHGLDPDAPAPDFIMPGFNTRMTEFQAALGVTQLQKLDRLLEKRRALAKTYDALFAGTKITPPGDVNARANANANARANADAHASADANANAHAYQSYVTLLPKEAAPRRAEIIKTLRERGIESTIGTYHMPMTSYFRAKYGFKQGDFPTTDDLFARALTLPLHDKMTNEEQSLVAREVLSVVQHQTA